MAISFFIYLSSFFLVVITYIIIVNKELKLEYLILFITITITSIGAWFMGIQNKGLSTLPIEEYKLLLGNFILIPYLLTSFSIVAIMLSRVESYRIFLKKHFLSSIKKS